MENAILMLVCGVGLVALLLSYQRWGDLLYAAVNHWKATLFVVNCVLAGSLGGMALTGASFGIDVEHAIRNPVTVLAGEFSRPSEDEVLATIETCKLFVTAKLNDRSRTPPEQPEDSPSPLLHLASTIAPDWDRCARTFGTTYWKHDTSVSGESGGKALCRAYRNQESFTSREVETWCDTVFADSPQ